MCTLLATTTELMLACFEHDEKNFTRIYNALKNDANCFRALVWCVQAGWEKMVTFLMFQEDVSPHHPAYNILSEAIDNGQNKLMKYLLHNSLFYQQEYFPDVINAILYAEKKCKHENAVYLLKFLLDRTSEATLEDKFSYKISESLRAYMHQRDYIHHTHYIRKVLYLTPIIEC